MLALVFTWFCVPECSGKSLEQIDYMFHEGVRLRDFGKYEAMGGEGVGRVEDKVLNHVELPKNC